MEVACNPYYRFNKFLVSSVGLWPYQNKLEKFLIRSIVYIAVISILVPMVLGVKKYWGDLDTVIECIPPIVAILASLVIMTNSIYNMEKMERVFSKMNEDWMTWSTGPEFEILNVSASKGRKSSIIFATYIGATVLTYLALPLLPQLVDIIQPANVSRPRETLYPSEYYLDEEGYFYCIMVHSYVASMITVYLVVSVDTIFMVVLQHACGIYTILGFKLNNLLKNDDNDYSMNNKDKLQDEINEEIKLCAHYHEMVMKFVSDICDCFSTCFFLVLGLNMVIMSVTGVQTMMNLDHPYQAIRFGCFTAAQMVHLFCLSIPCQQLMDHSVAISDSIYNGYWYRLSSGSRKLLLMIMKMSAEPCTFTAGKMYTFSIQNFAVVVKTSMSYFAVLSSVR